MISLSIALLLSQLSTEETARLSESVVHLAYVGPDGEEQGNGTGFIVDAQGTVVTNQHVIEPASGPTALPLVAIMADGTHKEILGVLAEGDVESKDLALLRLEPGHYQPLELDSGPVPPAGTSVGLLGSPVGLAFTASAGTVAAHRPEGTPKHLGRQFYRGPLVQLSAAAAHGSSGSPVVLPGLKVIGVISSGISEGSIHFAVPVSEVRAMMASVAPGTAPRPLGEGVPKWLALVISALVFAGVWWVYSRTGGRHRLDS